MAGHTTNARAVTGVVTTNTSTALTAPANTFIVGADVGAPIVGAGIPAGATLTAVASGAAATLSAAATASATVPATIGPELYGAAGFQGVVQETGAQQNAWTVAGVNAGNPPDVLTDTVTRVPQPTAQ